MKEKQLFIVWKRFDRRPYGMQSFFGYKLYFNQLSFKNRILRPCEYIIKFFWTLFILIKENPSILWIQLAPTPLLYSSIIYSFLFRRANMQIVADCHNSMFRRPWIILPFAVHCLNKCNIIIVHNYAVKEIALDKGVNFEKIHVLEDRASSMQFENKIKNYKILNKLQRSDQYKVFMPCSYDEDEPIKQVLNAAKELPRIIFILTGDTSRAKKKHDLTIATENVIFPGFVALDLYNNLFMLSDIILCLTKREGVQLCVANEAVGARKPMVMSNTYILKKLFYMGAVYVDSNDYKSLLTGINVALKNKSKLKDEVEILAKERASKWIEQASNIINTFKNNGKYSKVKA